MANATMKGGKLVIHVQGAAVTGSHGSSGGKLLSHGREHQPNKDGLLEYDLYFSPPAKVSGDKLKPVKATLNESSVPAGVKGVRIYAELNEMNGMLSAQKSSKRGSKKKVEVIEEKKEPEPKKEEKPLPKKEQPAPTRAPVSTVEKPVSKKDEAALKGETDVEKKKGRSWNPFHRKATPTPTPPPTPTPAKPKITPKKPEATPTPTPTPTPKTEETPPPKKEETKKKSRLRALNPLNWNPFHRKTPPPEPEQ
jgi:hypothetical protein